MSKLLFVIVMGLAWAASANQSVALGTANTVNIRGVIDGSSMTEAARELQRLSEVRGSKDYTIFITIDSPGGNIEDGEDFIQFAKTIPNVKTISLFAASMASAIVEALPGERLVTENGVLMFHRAKGGLSGQFENGELEVRLDFFKRRVRQMEKRSADRIGLSLKQYKKLVKDEWWMNASEAVEQHAADGIVDIYCTKALIETQKKIVFEFIFGTVQLQFSGCPLFRSPIAASDAKSAKLFEEHKEAIFNEIRETL